MIRLQNLTGVTFFLALALGITNAEAAIETNLVDTFPPSSRVTSRAKRDYQTISDIQQPSLIAQNLGKQKASKTSVRDDEMLDTLQKRQEKMEQGLEKIRSLTDEKTPQTESSNNSPSTGDEMMDAIKNREEKINNLKELKKLDDLLKDDKTIEKLQEQNFNLENYAELTVIQNIVRDQELSNEEMLKVLQAQGFKVEDLKRLKQLKKIIGKSPENKSSSGVSNPFALRLLTIGLPAIVLVFLIARPFMKGFAGVFQSNYQEKFGKPPVPEGSVNLHHRSFEEITALGNKIERINQDKFGNEEFLLLLKLKINMAKEAEGYQGLANCVDLMQAGIITQKSFLKLEQTELRYRSRKQQEFYQYMADNLTEDMEGVAEKEAFAKKVKKKQVEILPLITTEEGRDAINTYAKEINALSKYKLALKLLALFKKYELQDFSILKNVSDVVESLQGKDLVNSDDLVSPVLENYESFEKLGPILGLSEAESSPPAYAKILQVIGLTNRHGKSYQEFEQLVKLLKQWEKPYKAISLVRKEYTGEKYSIPAEFKEDIPGHTIYQKYAKFLPDL